MSRIFFDDTYIAVVPTYECTQRHKHSMLHVFVGNGTLDLDGDNKGNLIILEQNIEHCRPSGDIRFFLFVDPTSMFAQKLREGYLNENGIYASDADLKDTGISAGDIRAFVSETFGEECFIRRRSIDDRIKILLDRIDGFEYLEKKVPEIAMEMKYSESYLTHLFKKETGVSLKRYLLLRRVEYVWKKIANGEQITKVVMEAGFASPSHFSDTCRKLTGICAADVLR